MPIRTSTFLLVFVYISSIHAARWWWDNDGSILCKDMPVTWGTTLTDFLNGSNPSVTETCGNFLEQRSYCFEAFGEPEVTTTQPPTTTTTTTAAPPGPTQPGQIGTCNRWNLVQSRDSCNIYIQRYPGLTLADLVEWNSEIGAQCHGWTPSTTTSSTTAPPTNGSTTAANFIWLRRAMTMHQLRQRWHFKDEFFAWNSGVGTNCGSLWLGYYVCVSVVGRDTPTTTTSFTTTTTTTTGPTNGLITPTPTRPGMVDNCDDFHMVVDGDYCASIANCSDLWLGYHVCVSIIGGDPIQTTTATSRTITITTTTTTTATGPSPTQSGLITTCTSYYKVKPGNSCWSIQQQYGITSAQLNWWNPLAGTSCGSLWQG
ncbi:hypothetical protein BJX62DRAFT_231120 [Aspergillus germanicus]